VTNRDDTRSPRSSVEAILDATERLIFGRGPGKLRLSAVAAEAGISRQTLYKRFPTKHDLLAAFSTRQEQQFEASLMRAIQAQKSRARKLDAALRHLVTYLDGKMAQAVGVDPAFAIQTLSDSLATQVQAFVRVLGDAFDTVPAVRQRHLTREQAAEMFLRMAYSHYLIPHPHVEVLLANLRSFAGLSRHTITRAAG
jgi:AcrR family transcriptional regulator